MQKFFRYLSYLCVLFTLMAFPFFSIAHEKMEKSAVSTSLGKIVERINSTSDEGERLRNAEEMTAFIGKLKYEELNTIQEKEIEAITALLEDENQAIQRRAVISLGRMGPVAKSALPALERTLKKVEPPEQAELIQTGVSYPIEIRLAIIWIKGN